MKSGFKMKMFCFAILFLICAGIKADGDPIWTVKPKLQMTGLTEIGETTKHYCLQACLVVEGCNVASMDTEAEFPCKIQANSTDRVEESNESKNSVTTYFLEQAEFYSGFKMKIFGLVMMFLLCKEVKGRDSIWTVKPQTQMTGLVEISETSKHYCLQACLLVDGCNVASMDTEAEFPCKIQVNFTDKVEKSNEPKDSVTTYLLDRNGLYTAKKCIKSVKNKFANNVFITGAHDIFYSIFYCLFLESCDLFVHDEFSKNEQWMFVGILGSIKEEDLVDMPGSTTYFLDRSCAYDE